MTVNEIKKYIYDNQRVEYILEVLGCHNIKYQHRHNYFSASFPDGDNLQGINIDNSEYLNYRSFSRNVSYKDGKDLISLIEYIRGLSFIEALRYLHNVLHLEYRYASKPIAQKNKYDPLEVFKKIRRGYSNDVVQSQVLDETVLKNHPPLLHIDWFREGIMPWTAEKFEIKYSYENQRIVIPHRYWSTGELVGLNMRTTVDQYEELGIPKYWITPAYQKTNNLFGVYQNYAHIQKAGYVVVYESEKSVLKRDSLGDYTGVALSGKTISSEQARILIGLNVDIIISMDEGVTLQEIRGLCSMFYHIRNVYYTYDTSNLLEKKESIADKPCKVYDILFRNKVKYDSKEHREYNKYR